jgi:hypothetical protein
VAARSFVRFVEWSSSGCTGIALPALPAVAARMERLTEDRHGHADWIVVTKDFVESKSNGRRGTPANGLFAEARISCDHASTHISGCGYAAERMVERPRSFETGRGEFLSATHPVPLDPEPEYDCEDHTP